MAVGPINYTGMMPELDVSPLFALAQQLEQRKAVRAQQDIERQKIEIARQEEQRKADAEAAWQSDVGAAFADPTTENFQRLYRHTGKLEQAKGLLGNYTEEQRNRNVNAAMEVGGLLNAGNTDLALKKLKDRRTALVNGGESTEITDSIISDIESGDPTRLNRAKAIAGTVIATSLDPDKAGPLLDRLGYSATYQLDRDKLGLDQQRADEAARHNRAMEGNAAGNLALSQQREGRISAGGGKGGGGGSGGYEYRIGPDGKLQRRKR